MFVFCNATICAFFMLSIGLWIPSLALFHSAEIYVEANKTNDSYVFKSEVAVFTSLSFAVIDEYGFECVCV